MRKVVAFHTTPERMGILAKTVAHTRSVTDAEIWVYSTHFYGSVGVTDRVVGCDHMIHCSRTSPFYNRGWARNRVMRIAEENGVDVVVMSDDDFLLDPHALDWALGADKMEIRIPYSAVVEGPLERQRIPVGGGAYGVRPGSFWLNGGYCEAFVGWGCEDNAFEDNCILNPCYYPSVAEHQPHPQDPAAADGSGHFLHFLNSCVGYVCAHEEFGFGPWLRRTSAGRGRPLLSSGMDHYHGICTLNDRRYFEGPLSGEKRLDRSMMELYRMGVI